MKNNKRNFSFWAGDEMLKYLEDQQAKGINISFLVRELIKAHMERAKK